MEKLVKYTLIALFINMSFYTKAQSLTKNNNNLIYTEDFGTEIILGAENKEDYLPLLKNKRVGVVTNQTGILRKNTKEKKYKETIHLVDFLLEKNVDVKKIYSPEHGFRGTADAGEKVNSETDKKTGIKIVSLYGKNKKPTKEQLKQIDVLVFDIQDVGVRFYTYISTLHYILEAAAENNIEVIVLDRPNPNGHYIDGPVMQQNLTSFVGMHPVPIVYGMTIGEYALMINGEGWLPNKLKANLKVIPLKNYTHFSRYTLPVKPSPNLPNDKSINLYPSTCLFEGTNVNEGRGTELQFQVYGSPYLKNMPFTYTPVSREGALNPKFKDEICYGENLSDVPYQNAINLGWLINAYNNNTKEPFWTKNGDKLWIDQLSGTENLRKQIEAGWSPERIKATWQPDLEKFKIIRAKYLLY